jgi:hypothetical protein
MALVLITQIIDINITFHEHTMGEYGSEEGIKGREATIKLLQKEPFDIRCCNEEPGEKMKRKSKV